MTTEKTVQKWWMDGMHRIGRRTNHPWRTLEINILPSNDPKDIDYGDFPSKTERICDLIGTDRVKNMYNE